MIYPNSSFNSAIIIIESNSSPLVEIPPTVALIILELVLWLPIASSICFCSLLGVLSALWGVFGSKSLSVTLVNPIDVDLALWHLSPSTVEIDNQSNQ